MEIEHILDIILPYIIAILETIGVLIIVAGVIQSLISLFKNRFKVTDAATKLILANALALSLEYKLAAEILKTVMIRTVNEIIILSAVVILRIILTFVIHWEIKNTHAQKEME